MRLISSDEAWVKGKNGKRRLNSKYNFIGKMDVKLPNLITTASDKNKPTFKGNTYVFWEGDDFDFDSKGRIKGSYTPDGIFEPD